MKPEYPRSWIVEKLQSIYDIGFIHLEWDSFIDPEMKPKHPLVDQDMVNNLFGVSKVAYLTPEELRYQPTPEMMIKACHASNRFILKKCFKAWKYYFWISRAQKTHKAKLILVADNHWHFRRLWFVFQAWHKYTYFVKNRQRMAQSYIRNVNNQRIAKQVLKAWQNVIIETRRTRNYFAQLEKESRAKENRNDLELNDELLSSGLVQLSQSHRDRVAELPSMLQLKIFSYLNPIDLAHAACVCRCWLHIVEQTKSTNQVNLSMLGNKLTDQLLTKFIWKRRAILRQINLRKCGCLTYNGFRNLSSCANLQDINLSQCMGLTDDAVELIVTGCRNILYFNISNTSITDTTINHLATFCQSIQYLSLAHCPQITSRSIIFFNRASSFKSLIYLDLSGCHRIKPSGLVKIFRALNHVRHWILNQLAWLSDEELLVLGSVCPVIEVLEIVQSGTSRFIDYQYDRTQLTNKLLKKSDSPNPTRSWTCDATTLQSHNPVSPVNKKTNDLITDIGLAAIATKNLRRLILSDQVKCEGSFFESLKIRTNSSNKSAFPRSKNKNSANKHTWSDHKEWLVQLSIRYCPLVSDNLLFDAARSPCLTVLNLSHCTKLTDKSIEAIVQGACASQLRELYLDGCIRITNQGIAHIDGKLPRLAYLNLAYCPLISDSVGEYLVNCSQLWQLNLAGTKSGDHAISMLGSLPILKDLNMSKCKEITNLGLQKFCHSSIYLEKIDLSFCNKLSDSGIKTLAFCCHLLMTLNLAGCYQLTDLGVQYLSGVCQYLKFLDLSGCTLITENSLVYLRKGCKMIEHLRIIYCKNLNKHDVNRLTGHIPKVEFSAKEPPTEFLPIPDSTS